MAIQAIGKQEKPIQTVNELSLKREFEQGLVDQGFIGNRSPTGNVCYTHPEINYLFIICFADKYEIRAFTTSDVYDVVRKKSYTGRKEGLSILFN